LVGGPAHPGGFRVFDVARGAGADRARTGRGKGIGHVVAAIGLGTRFAIPSVLQRLHHGDGEAHVFAVEGGDCRTGDVEIGGEDSALLDDEESGT
jgi:hypothetical protein